MVCDYEVIPEFRRFFAADISKSSEKSAPLTSLPQFKIMPLLSYAPYFAHSSSLNETGATSLSKMANMSVGFTVQYSL